MTLSLQLDPVDRSNPLPWRIVVDAFSALQIKAGPRHPHGHGMNWLFGDIHAYAPLLGRDGAQLAELMAEGGVPTINVSEPPHDFAHLFWAGIIKLLNEQATYLYVRLQQLECIVVAPGQLSRVPSLLEDVTYRFECSTVQDLQAVVDSGFSLLDAMAIDEAPVLAWAEAENVDPVAVDAFKAYVSGKRPKSISLSWYGQPYKSGGHASRFVSAYAIWVDWRDEDGNIVSQVADRLKGPNGLTYASTDQGITLTYRGRVRNLTFDEIGAERYVTLRALNAIMAGYFEIRTLRKTLDADTHAVVVAPQRLWSVIDATHASAVAKRFHVIGPKDGFHGAVR